MRPTKVLYMSVIKKLFSVAKHNCSESDSIHHTNYALALMMYSTRVTTPLMITNVFIVGRIVIL